MILDTRDARTSLRSSPFLSSESKTKSQTKMKRRSGSVDNCMIFQPTKNYSEEEEYFVPLVDESHGCQADDQSQDSAYLSNDEQRLSPIPQALHRNAMPANPQSPSDEQQQESLREQHRQQYQYQQQQYNTSKGNNRNNNNCSPSRSRSGSPDHRNTNGLLPLRSRLVFTAHKRKSTFSFAVTSFCLLGFLLYGNARSSLRRTVREVEELVVFSEKLHKQLRSADHDMRRLEQELTNLDAIEAQLEDRQIEEGVLRVSSAFANPELIEEMEHLKKNLEESRSKANNLKKQVSLISKQDAVGKYGNGDIRIKMDLIFPPTVLEDGTVVADAGPHSIIMEMASLELMPHSVFTFLEMVSEGLLDGCSFIINALHVLKAAPLPYDGSSASKKAKEFSDAGLESVAFKEYSHSFPHEKYTVGFAADGSPSFYINSEDNTDIHVGDPCFARVVSGFDTVRRLDEMPTRNEIWFENRVGIKKVHIL